MLQSDLAAVVLLVREEGLNLMSAWWRDILGRQRLVFGQP